MALPSSGVPLSMSQINTELGRSSTATISLDDAESGVYGAINTGSTSYPLDARPASISEWYGYNHTSAPPPQGSTSFTIFNQGFASAAGGEDGACVFGMPDDFTLYFNIGLGPGSACPSMSTMLFEDSTGNQPFNGQNMWWYSDMCNAAYYITPEGAIEGVASCVGK